MIVVRVDRSWPQGPRLFVAGQRIHHFHAGLALIGLGARLVWRDRRDIAWRAGSAKSGAVTAATVTARPASFKEEPS